MIDKRIGSPAEAVSEIFDGATVMIGGFGEAGSPIELIHALIDQGAKELTVVNNNTFTNLMARENLWFASAQVARLREEERTWLRARARAERAAVACHPRGGEGRSRGAGLLPRASALLDAPPRLRRARVRPC